MFYLNRSTAPRRKGVLDPDTVAGGKGLLRGLIGVVLIRPSAVGGHGLMDPCEKVPTDVTAYLTRQQCEDITASAQVSLNLTVNAVHVPVNYLLFDVKGYVNEMCFLHDLYYSAFTVLSLRIDCNSDRGVFFAMMLGTLGNGDENFTAHC